MHSKWQKCSVGSAHGIPTLLRDGKPWFAWGINRPFLGSHLEAFHRLSGAGLRHFHCEATCTEDIYHPELRYWHGPGLYNGQAQHEYFSQLTKVCDDALFHLRVYVGAPEWWTNAHPSECQRYHDGSLGRVVQAAGERHLPSIASKLWREQACLSMEHYVHWLMDTGWSHRVFALLVSYGITWEWGILGSDGFLDYSQPMVECFREYLEKKYGTRDKLSQSWGIDLDFHDAAIPTAERRSCPGDKSGLRLLPAFQDVVDYQQALSEANAGLLLALAASAKRASGGGILVGSAYGYTLTAREQSSFTGRFGAGGFQGGHHALRAVLRSPDIDYLMSPFNYADRSLGQGSLLEHVPLASVHAHNKVFFEENDIYTHTCPPVNDPRAHEVSVATSQGLEEGLAYLRLAFAQAIVRGKHQWLTELAGWLGPYAENFSDPDWLKEVSRLDAMADELLMLDRSTVTELAFILDERSIAALSLDHKGFLHHVYTASVSWAHTGAPFDLLLLEDFIDQPKDRYRLVIPACVKMRDSVESLRTHLHKTGTRVWWDGTREWYPPIDFTQLITQIEDSGVHRYVCDGSTAWANNSMVLVHVKNPGPRTIRLRAPAHGTELFTGLPFVTSTKDCSFSFEFSLHSTALFLLKNP